MNTALNLMSTSAINLKKFWIVPKCFHMAVCELAVKLKQSNLLQVESNGSAMQNRVSAKALSKNNV